MKAYFEKVASGTSAFTAFTRNDSSFPFYWHYHPEYELTLIVDSHGQRLIGDSIADYGPGDLVLLGPNIPHSWRSGPVRSAEKEVHRAVVIQFREDFLGQGLFEIREMECVGKLLQHASNGLAFGHTETGAEVAKYLIDLPAASPARRLMLLLNALVDLAAEPGAQVLSSLRIRPICRLADQQRIDLICAYLNEHFEEEVDFSEVSDRFHMNQAHLCRFFKRATGRTMTEYLNELRIGAAAQLLIHTDQTVLDIAFRVGFGNYSNFNRQFKRIKGYGPRALRQQFSADMPAETSRERTASGFVPASTRGRRGKRNLQVGRLRKAEERELA